MTKAEEKALKAYPEENKENSVARFFFIDGYEQAQKDTIERAIEWLKANAADYAGPADDIVLSFDLRMHEDFIPDFKKAMEE